MLGYMSFVCMMFESDPADWLSFAQTLETGGHSRRDSVALPKSNKICPPASLKLNIKQVMSRLWNLSVKLATHLFALGYMLDYFLAHSSNFLESVLVAWQLLHFTNIRGVSIHSSNSRKQESMHFPKHQTVPQTACKSEHLQFNDNWAHWICWWRSCDMIKGLRAATKCTSWCDFFVHSVKYKCVKWKRTELSSFLWLTKM